MVEACRNLACTGARPVALTDGLNFGNPQYPHVYWQFDEAVRGIAEAAEGMGTPVISGNVSFYNESDLGEVPPTPVIGAFGLLENADDYVPGAPRSGTEGPILLVRVAVGNEQGGLGASAFLAAVHGIEDGYPIAPNVAGEKALCAFLAQCAEEGVLAWAHDVSEGGTAVCLAEVAIRGGVRIEVETNEAVPTDSALFGEYPGLVAVGAKTPGAADRVAEIAGQFGLLHEIAGGFGAGSGLKFVHEGRVCLDVDGTVLQSSFDRSLPMLMKH